MVCALDAPPISTLPTSAHASFQGYCMASDQPALDPPHRPLGVRAFNALGSTLKRMGLLPHITVERILGVARRSTGLTDFGDDSFRDPLTRLVDDYLLNAQLHPFGSLCVFQLLQTSAANRLLLEAAWKRHPETLQDPIRKPLYVVGMPRTGTTLLYNLLCQDPLARPLLAWETMFPARSPKADRKGSDRGRIFRTRLTIKMMNRLAPSLKSIHAIDADAPEEDGWLLNNTFHSLMFTLNGNIPNYNAYLKDLSYQEWLKVYRYYAAQLQLLQAGMSDRHWVLKSPAHQPTLGPLLETIPEACVVQTHRDPKQVIASCASLMSITRGILSNQRDLERSGIEFAERMAYATRLGAEAGERHAARICDVSFEALVADPIHTVQKIYQRFGYQYSDEMELRMRKWLTENPQHKHGVHRYRLEQFGLNDAANERIFAEYYPMLERTRNEAA